MSEVKQFFFIFKRSICFSVALSVSYLFAHFSFGLLIPFLLICRSPKAFVNELEIFLNSLFFKNIEVVSCFSGMVEKEARLPWRQLFRENWLQSRVERMLAEGLIQSQRSSFLLEILVFFF